MSNLERLQKSYLDRLINLKYNYATELLDNISDSSYSKLLETYNDLFVPISEDDADSYLHQPDVLDNIIKLLESTIARNKEVDLQRLEIIGYLNDLDEELLYKVFDFVEHHLED